MSLARISKSFQVVGKRNFTILVNQTVRHAPHEFLPSDFNSFNYNSELNRLASYEPSVFEPVVEDIPAESEQEQEADEFGADYLNELYMLASLKN